MKRYLLMCVMGLAMLSGSQAIADDASVKQALQTGEAQLNSGDYEDARDTAQGILKEDPANGRALYLLGRAQTFLKDYKQAIETLTAAEKAGVKSRAAIGAAQYHAGSTEATASLRRAVAEEPENADAFYFLGLSLYRDGQYVEARDSFVKARKLDSALEPEAFYFSGLAALQLKDTSTAKTELQQAVASDPDSDAGKSAKEALDKLAAGAKPYEFGVGLANQYDSNVLLVPTNGGLFKPSEKANKSGQRLVFTLRGAWLPKISGEWTGNLGYNLYQSFHWTHRDTLKSFDVTNHTVQLGAAKKNENSILSIPYTMNLAFLTDSGRYSVNHAVSPSYVYRKGANAFGVSDSIGYEDFARDDGSVNVGGETLGLNRDNVFNQLSGFYSLLFKKDRGNLTPSLGILYSNAKDASVWDYSGIRLGLATTLPLSMKWGLTLTGAYTGRSYANPYPSVSGAGVVTSEDRQDKEGYLGANLGYANKWFNFGTGLNYTRNSSTVAVFDYRRTIFTLGLGAQF